MNTVLGEHLESSEALVPLVNPRYDPNFRHLGIEVLQGGLRVNQPWQESSLILGKDARAVLRYFPEGAEVGNRLRVEMNTNAATHAMAGIGKPPLYGKAISIVPNHEQQSVQVLHLPLGKQAKAGDAVTVSIDMGHPGRIHITSMQLTD